MAYLVAKRQGPPVIMPRTNAYEATSGLYALGTLRGADQKCHSEQRAAACLARVEATLQPQLTFAKMIVAGHASLNNCSLRRVLGS